MYKCTTKSFSVNKKGASAESKEVPITGTKLAKTDLEEFLCFFARLKNFILKMVGMKFPVKLWGKNHITYCPCHAKNNPRLVISRGSNWELLLVCDAGCSGEEIYASCLSH